ncbi:heme exporter protein CcmD [Spartinivicinus poritis]|uniref:Heme exporter protein D n=1 Tax=Spartinivicinus poritis TaxID=2994640 RepID=A0ABT5U5F2_9GAMM|nr:heme exporter protein CcmD [Spartinivicinus sp. A2-2]MDE1461537.1 heme exporter protein CcmD [Spartinivicinus sp. A2-2]
MYFESWQQFWLMGGHGPYVWVSYAIGLMVVLYNVLSPWLKRKQLIKDTLRSIRREEVSQS